MHNAQRIIESVIVRFTLSNMHYELCIGVYDGT